MTSPPTCWSSPTAGWPTSPPSSASRASPSSSRRRAARGRSPASTGSLVRPAEGAVARARPQTRAVSSAPPPGREPWINRAWARIDALVTAQRRRRPWFDHLARAGGRYERTHGDLLAAGVTYFAFLGLFPVLLLVASVFGLFLAGDALLQQQLFDAIREAFPGALGEQLVHEVTSAVGSAGVTGLIGLVGFLYAGLRTVDKLRIGMELIWKGEVEKPDVLRDNLQDLLALVVLGGIGVLSLGLTGAVTQETSRLMEFLDLADVRGHGVLT